MSAGPLSRVESIENELPSALAYRKAAMEKALAGSERALAMQEEAINRSGRSGINSPLLAFAAGVGGATRTGSFGEALSNGIGGYAEANSREQRTELEKALRLAQIAKTRADLASTAGDIPLDGLMKSLEAISKTQTIRDSVAPVPSLSGFNPGGVAPVAQAATMSAPAPVQPTPPTPPTPAPAPTPTPPTPAPAQTPTPPTPAPAGPGGAPVPDFGGSFGTMSGPSGGAGAPAPASQPMGGPAPAPAPQPPPQQVAQAPQPAPQPAPTPPPQARAPQPQTEDEFLRSIAVPPPGTGWHEAYTRVLHAQQNPGLYLTPKNKAVLNEAQQAYQTYLRLPEVQAKIEQFKAAQQLQMKMIEEQRAAARAMAVKNEERAFNRSEEERKSEKDFISDAREKASAAVGGLETARRLRMYMQQPTLGTGPWAGWASEQLDKIGLGNTQNLERLGSEQFLANVRGLQGLGALSDAEGKTIGKMSIGTRSNPKEAMHAIDVMEAGYERAAAMPLFVRQAIARGASAGEAKEAWNLFRENERIEKFDSKGNPRVDRSAVKRWQEYLPGGRFVKDVYSKSGGPGPDTAQGQSVPQVKSAEDYDKIPPNGNYLDDKGNLRTKRR